jgi:hypothetical protein
MIEVRIPKEIREYKEKIFLNMTIRQIISVIAACGVSIVLYFKASFIPEEILNWLIVVVVLPIIFAGFFTYNEMYFEKFARKVILFNITRQKRFKRR